jgi:hypothetical protein
MAFGSLATSDDAIRALAAPAINPDERRPRDVADELRKVQALAAHVTNRGLVSESIPNHRGVRAVCSGSGPIISR